MAENRLFLAVQPPAVGQDKDDAERKDKKQLQGTWAIVSVTVGGKPEGRGGGYVVVSGDNLTFQGPRELKFTYKLDVTKKPREIDLFGYEIAVRGIYELQGKELRLCLNWAPGSDVNPKLLPRPSELKSPKGILLGLRREKP